MPNLHLLEKRVVATCHTQDILKIYDVIYLRYWIVYKFSISIANKEKHLDELWNTIKQSADKIAKFYATVMNNKDYYIPNILISLIIMTQWLIIDTEVFNSKFNSTWKLVYVIMKKKESGIT